MYVWDMPLLILRRRYRISSTVLSIRRTVRGNVMKACFREGTRAGPVTCRNEEVFFRDIIWNHSREAGFLTIELLINQLFMAKKYNKITLRQNTAYFIVLSICKKQMRIKSYSRETFLICVYKASDIYIYIELSLSLNILWLYVK